MADKAYNRVPNAMKGRDTLDIEIFGMEGIPPEDLENYEMRKKGVDPSKRARTGGGGGGSAQYGELTAEQIQQQLALHKAGNPMAAAAVVAGSPNMPTPPTPSAAAAATPSYQQYYSAYPQGMAATAAYPGQYYQGYPTPAQPPYPYRPPPPG